MKTYKDLEAEFYSEVKQLQAACKCPHNALRLKDNHSVVGCGCASATIEATCRLCNKWYVIFRGDEKVYKTSDRVKRILQKMIKNGYQRCHMPDKYSSYGERGQKMWFDKGIEAL